MDDNFFIIVMALVAGFIILQLRRTLGRKDGYDGKDEKTGDHHLRERETDAKRNSDNVISIKGGDSPKSEFQERIEDGKEIGISKSSPHYEILEKIRQYDRNFNLPDFIDGAEYAYGMILNAYWQGDLKTLRNYLSRDVHGQFEEAIADMKEKGHSFNNKIEDIEKIEIEEASIQGSMAEITLRYTGHMTVVIRDNDDNIVSGDADNPIPVVDIWTFCRDVRRGDPNWTLVSTSNA